MPSRLSQAARRPSRVTAPRAFVADQRRDGLREAQENLEFGGASIMAMTYMGQLGVAHSREELASEVQDIEAHGAPTGAALQDFQVRRLFHEIAAQTAPAAVDSAAILYAHTVLSSVIDSLCVVSMELDPEAWAGESAAPESAPGLPSTPNLPKAGRAWLEHASLGQKCEALFKVNRRGGHRDILEGFKYSADRLRKIDQLRQQLVEQSSFQRQTLEAEEKVDYLLKAAQFFINLLVRRQAEGPRKRPRRAAEKAGAAPEPEWVQGELL